MTSPPGGREAPLDLPAWPVLGTLLGYPLWWLLGLGEMVWWLTSVMMVVMLLRQRNQLRLPRGIGVWLFFLAWVGATLVMIDTGPRVLGWIFRALFLATPLVVLVYAFNARRRIDERMLGLCATALLAVMTVGAYLGAAFPLFRMTTPMAYLLPTSIKGNDFVREIVFRRLTQFDANEYGQVDPRPSAPYLYTNDWGLVFSLILPIVVAYALMVRRQFRFIVVVGLIVASIPAALLTQNRGMFLGLALAAVYLAVRGAIAANAKVIVLVVVGGLAAGLSTAIFPVADRIAARQSENDTTIARGRLYVETFERLLKSPILGYGGHRPSTLQGAPPSGTQGAVWEVLFASGFMGLALFMAFFVIIYAKTTLTVTPMGLAVNTAILVCIAETVFYSVSGTGLYMLMLAAGVVMGQQIDARRRGGRTPAPDLSLTIPRRGASMALSAGHLPEPAFPTSFGASQTSDRFPRGPRR